MDSVNSGASNGYITPVSDNPNTLDFETWQSQRQKVRKDEQNQVSEAQNNKDQERLKQARLHANYYSLPEQSPDNKESPYVQMMDKKIWGGKSTAEILDSTIWFKAEKKMGMSYNVLSLPMKVYFNKNLRNMSMVFLESPKHLVNLIKYIITDQRPKK
jgi:hypothetical protein